MYKNVCKGITKFNIIVVKEQKDIILNDSVIFHDAESMVHSLKSNKYLAFFFGELFFLA